jgi:hypothetical protein
MDINKNALSLAVIIIALSVGYYFAIFLPSNKQAETLSSNKSKCAQAADNVFSAYKKDGASGPTFSSNFTSHYNTKLDKCFVEITDNSSVSTGVSISDAIENRELAWAYITTGNAKNTLYGSLDINGKNTDLTKDQFETLEKQYMSE